MKRLVSIGLVAFLAITLSPFLEAQDKPPKFLRVNTVVVKQGMNQQYEEYVTKLVEASKKVERPIHWWMGQVALGGSNRTYVYTRSFDDWGGLDARGTSNSEVLTQAFGEKEAARLRTLVRSCVEGGENALYRALEDYTTNYRQTDPPTNFVWITSTEVKPEMVPEWRMYMAKAAPVREKSTSYTVVLRTRVLGPGTVYSSVSPFKEWKELESDPDFDELMVKAYGEEEARQLRDMRLRCIKNTERFVLRYRPDMSYLPAPAATN